ncbi:CDP-glycerol glycerophosphotransferase family protein [Virgibacillus sp. NKC19-3]|uniref:CDP-glycerol glycerophosphotransferase family protein n=1 Tax=Virgibacillus saliphilus TaxID=2831674 RepID=UPI001C9A6D09|nr:CDP-glycerol glycerophosphotransferase family protein [Virgibacillus sp. NKC19-3]MBY7144662.1 CDP-glycerol glycerophosphotransferase family protein [Virgibacillus sp. NKC19-3]
MKNYMDTPSPSFAVTIHELNWERINLKLEGLISGDINESYKLYLLNNVDQRIIPIVKYTQDNHLFSASINVSTLYNGDRIPDGKWWVIVENSLEEKHNVTIANNLLAYEEKSFPKRFSKDFKSGPKRVYKVHTELNQDNNLYLDVFFQAPNSKASHKRKRTSFKKKFADFRTSLFERIFTFAKNHVKKNGKRILFTSASRSSIGGNLKFVYDRMIERGLDKEYTIKKVFKPNIWSRSHFLDKFKLPFFLGSFDKIFIEDYQPMVNDLIFDDDTEVIQLWHANGAFKTFGYSRLGKPASPKIDSTNHRIYTNAITSSKHVIPYYAEAFAIDENKVIATGIPKTDIFFDEEYKEKTKRKVTGTYPKIKNVKKVIVFGPTFRGGGPKTAYYPMQKINFQALAEYCRETNSIILFKMHFLVKNALEIPAEFTDVLIDATDYREINDLLFVADVLITDYSSTIYESSLLNIPMIFYAFDLEEYISARDFYDEFESFVPGKITRNFDELITALEKEDYEFEKVKKFRELNFEFLDGRASDRVIDWLILDKR